MNENEYLAKTVNEQLEAGRPLVLISIMSLQGSTPRHSGTKMVVGADGKSYGTIGGSLIEAAAIRESQNVLSSAKSKILSYELSGKDATAPGMICGGKAELLLDYLSESAENREFSARWHEAVSQGNDFYVLTHLKGAYSALKVLGHAILHPDGTVFGSFIDSVRHRKPQARTAHCLNNGYIISRGYPGDGRPDTQIKDRILLRGRACGGADGSPGGAGGFPRGGHG